MKMFYRICSFSVSAAVETCPFVFSRQIRTPARQERGTSAETTSGPTDLQVKSFGSLRQTVNIVPCLEADSNA